jgi:predicted permease
MQRSDITGQRLVAIVLLGCVLFNYPVLSLFSKPVSWLGVPLLYLYIFAVWAFLIGLTAFLIERRK